MKKTGLKKRERRKKMKGFSLVSVIFVMLALSSVGISMTTNLSTISHSSVADVQEGEAFYAAEAGMQYVLAEYFMEDTDFSNNTSPTGNYGSGTPILFGNAQVWTEYSNLTAYSARVTVIAQAGSSIRRIQQDVAHAVPLQNPVFSGGNFTFGAEQICIFWGWICFDSGQLNGNLGTGGSATYPNHFDVNGTVTTGMQVVLPEVDIDPLIPIATDTTHEGNLTISGLYEQNVYVDGNVTITGGAIINGNVVASGNIDLGGNILVIGTLAAGGNIQGDLAQNTLFLAQDGPNGELLPALMAEGNVDLTVEGIGSGTDGLVMSGGNISYYADIQGFDLLELIFIDGALIAHGNIDIYNQTGYVSINTDSSLITAFAEPGSVKLENWKEV